MESPLPTSTVAKFRSLYEGSLSAQQSLGSKITKAGYVYAEILIRKLSMKTKNNINRANNTNCLDLPELRLAITEEIRHLTATEGSIDQGSNVNDFINVLLFFVLGLKTLYSC